MADATTDREGTATATELRRDEAIATVLHTCESHFPQPDFEISCDKSGTVWVSLADHSRSVGLAPWLLRGHSTDDLVHRVESKLGRAGTP